MKTLVLTAATPNLLWHCQDLLANKREYAERWGFDFKCYTNHFMKCLHPSYSKVPMISAMLKRYDVLLWIDMDACFTNFTVDFRERFGEYEIVTSPAQVIPPVYCCGVMAWRRTPRTLNAAKLWKLVVKDHPIAEHPWEQWHFNSVMYPPNIPFFFNWSPPPIGFADLDKFMYVPEDAIGWKPGDFICHLNPWMVSRTRDNEWYYRKVIFDEQIEPQIVR